MNYENNRGVLPEHLGVVEDALLQGVQLQRITAEDNWIDIVSPEEYQELLEEHHEITGRVAERKATEAEQSGKSNAGILLAASAVVRREFDAITTAWVDRFPVSRRRQRILQRIESNRGFMKRLLPALDPSLPARRERLAAMHEITNFNGELALEQAKEINDQSSNEAVAEFVTTALTHAERITTERRKTVTALQKKHERSQKRRRVVAGVAGYLAIGAIVGTAVVQSHAIRSYEPEFDRHHFRPFSELTQIGGQIARQNSISPPKQAAVKDVTSFLPKHVVVSEGQGYTQVIQQTAASSLGERISSQQAYDIYETLEQQFNGNLFEDNGSYIIQNADASLDFGIREAKPSTWRGKVFKALKRELAEQLLYKS